MKSLKKLLNQLTVPMLTFALMVTVQNQSCLLFLGDGQLDSTPDDNTEKNLLKLLKKTE